MEVWNIWSFLAASRQTSSFPWTRGDDVSIVSSLHVTGLDFGTSTDNWFAQPIWEFSLAGTLVDQGMQIETKNPFYLSWTCWRILRFKVGEQRCFCHPASAHVAKVFFRLTNYYRKTGIDFKRGCRMLPNREGATFFWTSQDCISYKLYLAQTCDVGIEGFIPIAAAFHAW